MDNSINLEKPLVDILIGKCTNVQCLGIGFVRLVDIMPRLVPDGFTADYAICQMARVSYGQGTKSMSDDRTLIRYLMRHSHSSPFEACEVKVHMKLPIFVARQIIRHRTASVNEISGRYSVLTDEFYLPTIDEVRSQSTDNKQGGDLPAELTKINKYIVELVGAATESYQIYKRHIAAGISREQARINLPLNLFTSWYWKCDLSNILHFLALRCDKHAQFETRAYANALLELIKPIFPYTIEAWEDYHPMRSGLKLSRLEADALRKSIKNNEFCQIESSNKREQQEWIQKYQALEIDKM